MSTKKKKINKKTKRTRFQDQDQEQDLAQVQDELLVDEDDFEPNFAASPPSKKKPKKKKKQKPATTAATFTLASYKEKIAAVQQKASKGADKAHSQLSVYLKTQRRNEQIVFTQLTTQLVRALYHNKNCVLNFTPTNGALLSLVLVKREKRLLQWKKTLYYHNRQFHLQQDDTTEPLDFLGAHWHTFVSFFGFEDDLVHALGPVLQRRLVHSFWHHFALLALAQRDAMVELDDQVEQLLHASKDQLVSLFKEKVNSFY